MTAVKFAGTVLVLAGAAMMLSAERNRRKKKIRSWRFVQGYLVFLLGGIGIFL